MKKIAKCPKIAQYIIGWETDLKYWKYAALVMGLVGLSGCNDGSGQTHYQRNQTRAYSPQPDRLPPEPSRHLQSMDAISRSRLRRRPILNKAEEEVFWALRDLLARAGLSQQLLVCPQVNLGSALSDMDSNRGSTAYNAIRCKRADFCLVGIDWQPVAFIEFQGYAHHGTTLGDNIDALERDETKQLACSQAGVLYHAIPKKALYDIDAYLDDRFLPFLMDAMGEGLNKQSAST